MGHSRTAGSKAGTQPAMDGYVAQSTFNSLGIAETYLANHATQTLQIDDVISCRAWRDGQMVYCATHVKGQLQPSPQALAPALANAPEQLASSYGQATVSFSQSQPVQLVEQPAELLSNLYAHVAGHYCQSQRREPAAARLAPWQERQAKALIADSLGQNLSISRLAQACGLSRSHFSRAFRGSTGLSPHQWLTQMRIERAKTLLSEPRPVAEVALDCGFSDQAHLARVFSRLVGLTPSQWRRGQQH